MKVNLRPLWSPAAAALAVLSQRFGDVVWDLIYPEIQRGEDGHLVTRNLISGELQSEEVKSNSNDIWEDERSWRDPSAHKLRLALSKWLDPTHRTRELINVRRTYCLLQEGLTSI